MKRSARTSSGRPPYHHGALREALIDAGEALLAERGVEGFSLREVARRVGVSPAAPAHHFGDASGLLVAIATAAFDGLAEALSAGNARGGDDAVARLREQGIGYVTFALRYPGRFGLMFRVGRHDDPGLRKSGAAAFALLENGVRDLFDVPASEPLDSDQLSALLGLWSVVHGFAHLALSGQLDRLAGVAKRDAYARRMLGPLLQRHIERMRTPAPSRTREAPEAPRQPPSRSHGR